jgi:hypothetical protein
MQKKNKALTDENFELKVKLEVSTILRNKKWLTLENLFTMAEIGRMEFFLSHVSYIYLLDWPGSSIRFSSPTKVKLRQKYHDVKFHDVKFS